MNKITHVIKRTGAIVPFNPLRITNAIYRAAVEVGGRDKEKAEELSGKVIKTLEEKFSGNKYPSIEEIQDNVEEILIKNGHTKVAKAYILYREERGRARETDSKYASQPSENIPWAKIWHILDWAQSKNLHTIDALNKRILKGEFPHIVHESEAAYENDIDTAINMITERGQTLKMVLISGPSSSGKTTTTIKLEQRLKKTGVNLVPLNIDNYFLELELHPKDEFGDYDFETPRALELELINEHLKLLSDGKEVSVPFYDFKTGKRSLDTTKIKLKENEILLIDSHHGLYPPMTDGIPNEKKFKLYLEPLLQMKNAGGKYIRWTDIRLMRRMLRDSVQRTYNPQQTLEHWHYVRTGEMRNIIPYHATADFIINSGMPYELSLYRHKLISKFEKWAKLYKDNPLRIDAYTRAERIYNLLKSIEPIEDDSPVPKDSVLREFIGGSILKY
jgi:uridine kinase